MTLISAFNKMDFLISFKNDCYLENQKCARQMLMRIFFWQAWWWMSVVSAFVSQRQEDNHKFKDSLDKDSLD